MAKGKHLEAENNRKQEIKLYAVDCSLDTETSTVEKKYCSAVQCNSVEDRTV